MAVNGRELVIEVERVTVVRKRAATRLRLCEKCGQPAEFISLREAADLFEVPSDGLLSFLQTHSCHFESVADATQVCVPALIAAVRSRKDDCGIRFIGC